MQRIFTDDEKLGIYNDYANCIRTTKIAEKYHTSPEKIKLVLLEFGVDIHDYDKAVGIKKHGPNYWNNYENLEALAKICSSRKDFDNHSHSAWIAAKRNGWLDELAEKYFKPKVKETVEPVGGKYMIYAIEIGSTHSVYVGQAINLAKRMRSHKWSEYGDALAKYCKDNSIEIPDPIVLQSGLEADEAKDAKKKFIAQYKSDGWAIINAISKKEKTEPKGRFVKWTYESCKQEVAKYETKSDLRKNSPYCYKISFDKGWLEEFYPDKSLSENVNTFEACRELALQYNSLREVKEKYPNLYKKIKENKWNDRINRVFKRKRMGIAPFNNDKVRSLNQFIEKSNEIHKNKYDYSKVVYINSDKKVEIICPKHGSFFQSPRTHLRGRGCRQCWIENAKTYRASNTEEFIAKAKAIHGDKYDYSKVEYAGVVKKVTIICPIHGEFRQQASTHLAGNGCIICGRISAAKKTMLTQDEFIERSSQRHNGKYDYSKAVFSGTTKPVTIICPKHGEFVQSAAVHLSGSGCPKCGNIMSSAEYEIADYIGSLIGKDKVIMHDKLLMRNGKELDIVVPDYKLAIEFDGLVWHTEKFGADKNYHLGKTEACEKLGYRLVHIFEDEWKEHKDIVLSKIRHMVKCDEDKKCIGARKCRIQLIGTQEAKDFLDTYHIQGFGASTIYYGGYYGDELIGAMAFRKNTKDCNDWELTRFATTDSYRLPGLADKIFKQFIKDYDPDSVKSFLDRRWNHPGNTVYEKLGFKIDKIEKPDYSYVINNGHDRVHKFLFRKQKLSKKYELPLSMTEKEMADELEAYRIWNCGLVRYLWTRKENE